jgi:site-specific recombinase XerD
MTKRRSTPSDNALNLWAYDTTAAGFIPDSASRSVRSRLSQFITWLAENEGRDLLTPDLAAYKAHLSGRMTRASVNAHITTIRARYRSYVLKNNAVRDTLYRGINRALVDSDDLRVEVERLGGTKAYVDERLTRLENDLSQVKVRGVKAATVKTDQQVGTWLTLAETRVLLDRIRRGKGLTAVRDAAIVTVLLTTGIRAGELASLKVEDVEQTVDGQPVVFVRDGKGNKSRIVPLGENVEVVRLAVARWREAAGIQSGWLFRGFTGKNRARVRDNKLSVRALGYILDACTPRYAAVTTIAAVAAISTHIV